MLESTSGVNIGCGYILYSQLRHRVPYTMFFFGFMPGGGGGWACEGSPGLLYFMYSCIMSIFSGLRGESYGEGEHCRNSEGGVCERQDDANGSSMIIKGKCTYVPVVL